MKFTITGFIRLRNAGLRPFKKVVEANSKKHAIDVVYSLFGSHNGLKRTQITIEEIKEGEA